MRSATPLHPSAVCSAPGKVILLGEHAVNREQSAIAASIGLRVRCRVSVVGEGPYVFRSGGRGETATRDEILRLWDRVEGWRAAEDYASIRTLTRERFFGPQLYVLAAALGEGLPAGMRVEYESQIPPSSGFGSGGAAYVALARGLAHLLDRDDDLEAVGRWAHLGDVLAHGGIASGLDSQTSLHGGFIRYSLRDGSRPLPWDRRLCFVAAHCGVSAATAEVNGRVREWLAREPSRLHYFQEIGRLSEMALAPLAEGDGERLGHLVNLNQLLLERIGVSCPELDRLIAAALEAGAYGAKLSGSGGGGILFAVTDRERRPAVVRALEDAGGRVYDAALGVCGAELESSG